MRGLIRLALLVTLGAALQGISGAGAARLNADTVLFGTVVPSASAAPGSCLTLTAVAHELQWPGNIISSPSTPTKPASSVASARVCPEAPAPAAVPFALLFADIPAPTDPSQLLSVNLTVTQLAAGPSPMELRWEGAMGVAPGAAHLALDMALAERRPQTSSKRTPKPSSSSAPKTAPSPSNTSLEASTAHVCSRDAPAEDARSAAAAPAAVAALVALAAGMAIGNAMRGVKKAGPATCEVACSPFPAAALRRCGKALGKWSRDDEGRLQREGEGGAESDDGEEMEAAEE